MKKLTSTLGVFAAAAAIAAAFAMSPAPKKVEVKTSEANYHWFSLSTGAYLGVDSDANKQSQCGTPLNPCVRGADGVDENENPTGEEFIMDGQIQL